MNTWRFKPRHVRFANSHCISRCLPCFSLAPLSVILSEVFSQPKDLPPPEARVASAKERGAMTDLLAAASRKVLRLRYTPLRMTEGEARRVKKRGALGQDMFQWRKMV